MDIFRLLNTGW